MGRDDRTIIAVEKTGSLFGLLKDFLEAYKARTEVLANQGGGDNGKLDAIIEMLRGSASLPADLKLIGDRLALIHELLTKPKLEVRFVYKVKNDHQDESFSISIGGVTDAEGEALPNTKGLTVAVESSDPEVVSVDFDPSSHEGTVHFGRSGVASLTASVTNAKGEILGSGAADFTVTTGDPAAVSDVKIAFGGLTEEAPEEEELPELPEPGGSEG